MNRRFSVRSVVAVLLCAVGVAITVFYTIFFVDAVVSLGGEGLGDAVGAAFGLVFMILCAIPALVAFVIDVLLCLPAVRGDEGIRILPVSLLAVDVLLSLYIIISSIVTIAFA